MDIDRVADELNNSNIDWNEINSDLFRKFSLDDFRLLVPKLNKDKRNGFVYDYITTNVFNYEERIPLIIPELLDVEIEELENIGYDIPGFFEYILERRNPKSEYSVQLTHYLVRTNKVTIQNLYNIKDKISERKYKFYLRLFPLDV